MQHGFCQTVIIEALGRNFVMCHPIKGADRQTNRVVARTGKSPRNNACAHELHGAHGCTVLLGFEGGWPFREKAAEEMVRAKEQQS